jgi:hypothetical protein
MSDAGIRVDGEWLQPRNTFSVEVEEKRDIKVYDRSPYDGQISTKYLSGIESTFGYDISGADMYAEFIVRDNKTLADLAEAKGFDSFNYLQIVTEYPSGFGVGCLDDNLPHYDPQIGGCLFPLHPADDLPYYYDVGDEWVGTDHYVGDIYLEGYDRNARETVDVGFSFNDRPGSPYASSDNPMSFMLFPVGVKNNGRTYTSLIDGVLNWSSTYDRLDGGVSARSSALGDGLEDLYLTADFIPFNELPSEQLSLLYSTGFTGYIGTSAVPEPSTLFLFGIGLAGLGFARRRKSA